MSFSKSLLAVCSAGVTLSLFASAQTAGEPGAAWTNLGELRAKPAGEHVLTGKAAALVRLESLRADLAPYAYQEPLQFAASSGLEMTNTGELKPFVHEGHVLTAAAAEGGPVKVLYAPSEADDAAYRAAIAAAIGGGATVDYFDARAATPSVATLAMYDAVYTWANFAYADNVTLGNNLAAYNDAGGTVVLGVFCTYTSGNFLSGSIMTSAYCPVVSPFGNNHFSSASYAGDGTTCIYNGVTTLTSTYRDFLVTQGSGVVDGTYTDAEICHAYRSTGAAGQGDVVYSNGSGASQLGGSGQWGAAVGNSCVCAVSGGGLPTILYAPSEADDAAYRAAISAAAGGATVDYFDASAATPSGAVLAAYDCVHVWANFAFADPVAYGNNLAAFADAGGDVVLGAFCTYTSGNSLDGAIMDPGYCPVVSPSGTNHFSNATDAGPFNSCLTAGVTSLTAFYRDVLALQGGGIFDSRYDSDNEYCTTFRLTTGTQGDVVHANGAGGFPVLGTGEWAQVIANACGCDVGAQGPPPSCTQRFGVLALNPTACSCGTQPFVGQTFTVLVGTTPSVGSSVTATFAVVGLGGPVSGIPVFGHELLILPPFLVSTAFGTHNLPIPPSADFIGASFTIQGGRTEAGPPAIVLTNAIDFTVGR